MYVGWHARRGGRQRCPLGLGHCQLGWGKGQAAATRPMGWVQCNFVRNEDSTAAPPIKAHCKKWIRGAHSCKPLCCQGLAGCKQMHPRSARSGGGRGQGHIDTNTADAPFWLQTTAISLTTVCQSGRDPQTRAIWRPTIVGAAHSCGAALRSCKNIHRGGRKADATSSVQVSGLSGRPQTVLCLFPPPNWSSLLPSALVNIIKP